MLVGYLIPPYTKMFSIDIPAAARHRGSDENYLSKAPE